MQTTLLGFAIALIAALAAALIGPHFLDWSRYRPAFETEASALLGVPVRVKGGLDVRLLPTPSLKLANVVIDAPGDGAKVTVRSVNVEFSLGALMRGQWRATELTLAGALVEISLDEKGGIGWSGGRSGFLTSSLSIDRLDLSGRLVVADRHSGRTLDVQRLAFSGEMRAAAGALRGEGNASVDGHVYPFRLALGRPAEGEGARVKFNLDSGNGGFLADADGVVTFAGNVPRFEGMASLSQSVTLAGQGGGGAGVRPSWRVGAKVKADAREARLEQIDMSYGAEDAAFKATGVAQFGFGGAPFINAVLTLTAIDADRLEANADGSALTLARLRRWLAGVPPPPFPTTVSVSADAVMLGGRPLQSFGADLTGSDGLWTIGHLEFRAPGATAVVLSGQIDTTHEGTFSGRLGVDAADPGGLIAWLTGAREGQVRAWRASHLDTDLLLSPSRFVLDNLALGNEGGQTRGRIAWEAGAAEGAGRLDVALSSDKADLDLLWAAAQGAVAQTKRPPETRISLEAGEALLFGQTAKDVRLSAELNHDRLTLGRLAIGGMNGLAIEGQGTIDLASAGIGASAGRIALKLRAAAFASFLPILETMSPALAQRLAGIAGGEAPASADVTLEVSPTDATHTRVGLTADVTAQPANLQLKVTGTPERAALLAHDWEKIWLTPGEASISLRSPQGRTLVDILGLSQAIGARDGLAVLSASLRGPPGGSLAFKASLDGEGYAAAIDGVLTQPQGEQSGAASGGGVSSSFTVTARDLDIGPLLGMTRGQQGSAAATLKAQGTSVGSRVALDRLDLEMGGSHLRGKLVFGLGADPALDGDLDIDSLPAAAALGVLTGAAAPGPAGTWATQPFSSRGLAGDWRLGLGFKIGSVVLPGEVVARDVAGKLTSNAREIVIDDLRGRIAGGEANGRLAFMRRGGLVLDGRANIGKMSAQALPSFAAPLADGVVSIDLAVQGEGRSPAALIGSLSGQGTVALVRSRIAGFDPDVFRAVTSAYDGGSVPNLAALGDMVLRAWPGRGLSLPDQTLPFTLQAGRLRLDEALVKGEGADVILTGSVDLIAAAVNLRATMRRAGEPEAEQPSIDVWLQGPVLSPTKSFDIAALQSWLASRAIEMQTHRVRELESGRTRPAAAPTAPPASSSAPVSPPLSPKRAPLPKPRSQLAPPLPPPINLRAVPGSGL